MNKYEKHKELLNKLENLYKTKNTDYGDSVSDTYKKYGMVSFLVRMQDKLNRVHTLTKKEAKVQDEKIQDTLLDLANYALLAIIELEDEKDINFDIDKCMNKLIEVADDFIKDYRDKE